MICLSFPFQESSGRALTVFERGKASYFISMLQVNHMAGTAYTCIPKPVVFAKVSAYRTLTGSG